MEARPLQAIAGFAAYLREYGLAVGVADVAAVREAMQAGAREFLDVDNLRADLAAALERIESTTAGASQRGKIVTVFSPSGGAGVSTVEMKSTAGTGRPSGPGTSWVTFMMYSLAPMPLKGGMM